MPDKLTDNEIKKSLECCLSNDVSNLNCTHCPNLQPNCMMILYKYSLDLINRQKEKYDHLLKVARKMHTWIFLNTGDEQAAYDEIGLSDEDNMLLGYMGEIMLVEKELTDNDQ